MTDAREKQPKVRVLDFKKNTEGAHLWEAKIHASPYFGIKAEDVYSPSVIIQFRADSMRAAAGFSEAIAKTIGAAHDIWEVWINSITKAVG